MVGLTLPEQRLVRGAATLLRVADSLDRSHRQIIHRVRTRLSPSAATLYVDARQPVDLELWDAAHEAKLFRRVFGRKLLFQVSRVGSKRRGRNASAYLVRLPS
jgi:exopolyphosphatase/guanosine-5'-triphosphate,3'-diphosphate pyrophosphatase